MIEIADDNAEGVEAEFPVPRIEVLPTYPSNCNVMQHDLFHQGTPITRGWVALHGGASGSFPLKYLILVNAKTGQRFKIVLDGS